MTSVTIEIPGVPLSPNAFRRLSTRGRMRRVRLEREWAQVSVQVCVSGVPKITGPCRIQFTVYRRRLLDPMSNLPASLKHYQDGVCRALLPLGDGPGTPYEWMPVQQQKVKKASEERVVVQIEPRGTREGER